MPCWSALPWFPMHTQREAAEFLVTHKQTDYLFIVKGNQPGLQAQLRALPWREVPVLDRTRDHGHGRVEIHTLKARHHDPVPECPLIPRAKSHRSRLNERLLRAT